MSAQTRYGFNPPIGIAGGIVDLAPYAIDTFNNEEDNGDLKFGFGVVRGTNGGLKIPTTSSEAGDFIGVVVNNRTREFDLDGKVYIRKNSACGVMRYGRIYGVIADELTIAAGDAAYLIISGDDAGKFTNVSGENTIAVSGCFNVASDSGKIAQIELFNAPAPAVADESEPYTLPTATADTLGGVKVGTGLKIENGVLSVDEG